MEDCFIGQSAVVWVRKALVAAIRLYAKFDCPVFIIYHVYTYLYFVGIQLLIFFILIFYSWYTLKLGFSPTGSLSIGIWWTCKLRCCGNSRFKRYSNGISFWSSAHDMLLIHNINDERSEERTVFRVVVGWAERPAKTPRRSNDYLSLFQLLVFRLTEHSLSFCLLFKCPKHVWFWVPTYINLSLFSRMNWRQSWKNIPWTKRWWWKLRNWRRRTIDWRPNTKEIAFRDSYYICAFSNLQGTVVSVFLWSLSKLPIWVSDLETRFLKSRTVTRNLKVWPLKKLQKSSYWTYF